MPRVRHPVEYIFISHNIEPAVATSMGKICGQIIRPYLSVCQELQSGRKYFCNYMYRLSCKIEIHKTEDLHAPSKITPATSTPSLFSCMVKVKVSTLNKNLLQFCLIS